MKRFAWLAAIAAIFATASVAARAQDAYTTVNLHMRAAPDVDYPLIRTLPAGTAVSVQGCIDGWLWCDVIAYGDRGWVAGDYLEFFYRNHRVLLPDYGARYGIPIISFVIGDYWGRHYSHRSFYRNHHHRDRWYNHGVHYSRHSRHHGYRWDRRSASRHDGRHEGRRDGRHDSRRGAHRSSRHDARNHDRGSGHHQARNGDHRQATRSVQRSSVRIDNRGNHQVRHETRVTRTTNARRVGSMHGRSGSRAAQAYTGRNHGKRQQASPGERGHADARKSSRSKRVRDRQRERDH
jgi:uncharacterized protein YraI